MTTNGKKGKQQKTSKSYKNISKTAVCRLEYFLFGDNSIGNSVISIALCWASSPVETAVFYYEESHPLTPWHHYWATKVIDFNKRIAGVVIILDSYG